MTDTSVPQNLQRNVLLAPFTWMKVGGPSRYFLEAVSADEMVQAVRWARERKTSFIVIGGGSNLLVADRGYDGLVIRVKDDAHSFEDTTVRAAAGVNLTRLATLAGNRGLAGMEFSVGIPGTVGGAIRGNAGAFDGEMKDVVTSVTVLGLDSKVIERQANELEFRYRHSLFKINGEIILAAVLMLKNGDAHTIRETVRKRLEYRREHQPLALPSLGSTFKNVPLETLADAELEETYRFSEVASRGMVAAGFLIDRLGLKGFTIGDAEISQKHANFIVNHGRATARDVAQIIETVKERARVAYKGLELEPEVQLLGF